jgi:hypothetical protein
MTAPDLASTAISSGVGGDNWGEIVMYQPEGEMRLEVRVENETVWLTQAQMVKLFDKDQSVIARHIKNVFKEGELPQESNMQILHNTLSKFKPTTIYSLDVIISVGYRVKSFRGTQFRQWANQVLKGYILKGYAVNQRKIATDLQIADRLHEQRQLIESQGAEIAMMRTIHDRFLLVDDKVYHFGASFKDMGNEMTAFSVLDFVTPAEVIEKIQESMKGR